jgi:hypothetical protein
MGLKDEVRSIMKILSIPSKKIHLRVLRDSVVKTTAPFRGNIKPPVLRVVIDCGDIGLFFTRIKILTDFFPKIRISEIVVAHPGQNLGGFQHLSECKFCGSRLFKLR